MSCPVASTQAAATTYSRDRKPRSPAVVAAFIAANNDATAPVALNMNQHGLTGSWYQPSTSGQGVELEVFKDLVASDTGFVQGSWFTYDYAVSGAGEHSRWYTFGGNVRTTDAIVSCRSTRTSAVTSTRCRSRWRRRSGR